MGLDVYLWKSWIPIESFYSNYGKMEEVRMSSPTYPNHLFKIGYFRSNYNNGGFNDAIQHYLNEPTDLYYIFQRSKNEYAFKPNWNKAYYRVKRTIKLIEEKRENLSQNTMYQEHTTLTWLYQGLLIIKETVEYVLNHPEKELFFLYWSS